MRQILAMQNCTYLFLWHFEFNFSKHEFHFPFKHSDPNPMQKNKLKKCFFCRTLKCSVNPRRAKEKYQIVKKKHILKMGQLNNKAFRNNRNVKDSKILQFQPDLVSTTNVQVSISSLPIYMWLFTISHSVHGAIAISGYILPYLHMLRCGRVTPPIELGGQLWQSRPGQDRARLVVVPIRLQLLFLRWAEHRGHSQTTWSVLGPSTNDVIPFYPSFPHITTFKTSELSNVPRFYTPDSLKYGDVIYGWPLIIKNHSQNCWRVTRRRRAWRKMLPWRCATSSHLHVIWMDENSRGSLTTVNTNASPRAPRLADWGMNI